MTSDTASSLITREREGKENPRISCLDLGAMNPRSFFFPAGELVKWFFEGSALTRPGVVVVWRLIDSRGGSRSGIERLAEPAAAGLSESSIFSFHVTQCGGASKTVGMLNGPGTSFFLLSNANSWLGIDALIDPGGI